MSRQIDRRSFLRTTTTLTAGATLAWPYHFTSACAAAKSKNDRPNIGAVGVGGRGSGILQQAAQFGDVIAVCDVDVRHVERARQRYEGKPDIYSDYRKMMERNDIDVIINGTPDHWHTAINVAACRAGKDVYTEKPMTLTVDEGKILSKVVAETKRIVQVGAQQRSGQQFQTAIELVRNGRIGKLRQVWVALPYYSTAGGPFPSQEVPSHLDWDFYQGQAPEHAYCPQRCHAVFRWWYEYAGGIITDWGNHHVDIAHWGMDCETTGPTSIEARAIFPNPKGDQYYNTPDRFFSRMKYDNGVELLYFAALKQRARFGQVDDHQDTTPEQIEQLFGKDVPDEIKTFDRNGIMFIGDRGRVFVNRGGLYGEPAEALKDNPLPEERWKVRPSSNHMRNFCDCVKTREEPVAPVRIEHRTISACHLTNISLRLGRPLVWDPVNERIIGDDEADGWLKRKQRKPYTIEG